MEIKLSELGLLAMQYLNTPYRWGGNDFDALDCSGFILKVLRDYGHGLSDMTAQDLHNWCLKRFYVSSSGKDCLHFYGRSDGLISHVSLGLTDTLIIHAASGDHTTLTLHDATKRDARVKIQRFSVRRDLVAAFKVERP